jgi:ATP-dependent Clp protease ATP-binding subunit ClpC
MALYLIGIAVGIAVARRYPAFPGASFSSLVARLRDWLRQAFSIAKRTPAAPSTPEPELLPAPEPAPLPLSARLRQLEEVFLPSADNAAHPHEFFDQGSFREAVALLNDPEVPLKTLTHYAFGTNWGLACAAFAALAGREDRLEARDQTASAFDRLAPWVMYFALHYFLTLPSRPPAGALFVNAKDWWKDNAVLLMVVQEYFDDLEQRGETPGFGRSLEAIPQTTYPVIRAFLERFSGDFARGLLDDLSVKQRALVDRSFLESFGRFWSSAKDADLLVEPEAWKETLASAEIAATSTPFKSLLAAGEPRIGKTSFFRILAMRLQAHGWTVFEAGGADLMAGQQYFGQLEGRIQKAVAELSASKKLIWYIPDIMQIAMSGTHQGQAASVLDQILPAISAGRLVVWTEASASGAARVLRIRPSLRNSFEVIRFDPLSKDETLSLAQGMLSRLSAADALKIEPGCAETALASARQYLSSTSLPGSVLDLLKSALARAVKGGSRSVSPQDVIQSLSQATGVPAAILDSKERADLASIRAYFAARVIGQEEAVATIVDRIAMLKAGLNDPGKPIGVFLFAGPTGTGKTELAKTLAEFLFGSADRLIRLDMSEYQTPDTLWKILGSGDPNILTETLISRVRKQPFSVVLLDEFEKAHANIWDLFLQVFDDARMTDTMGQEADFRHCIIILTTNLGATSHRSADLGFLPASASFSNDQVLRAIGQTFRPEFQNRLDKVIVFHPLTRDLMRSILKKELARVLERRGLKDREWAVEWEASALEFLLEKGFSPEMGARPLKRAIDQYVIAPLAATIVERRFPEGDQFVFFRSDGKAIQAEFVDPDGDSKNGPRPANGIASETAPTLQSLIAGANGLDIELRVLDTAYSSISEALQSERWETLKSELAERMQEEAFWTDPGRRAVLARVALMDRVSAAAATAESLRNRLARGAGNAGKHSPAIISRLALQIYLVNEGIRDVFEAAPIEVALLAEPALGDAGQGGSRDWCHSLIAMYKGWAAARNMHVSEAVARVPDPSVLVVSGFGAYRTLLHEAGLHILEVPEGGKTVDRFTARIRVAPLPLDEIPERKLREASIAILSKAETPNTIVRRYRSGSSPLVRDMVAGWRTGRYDAVLRGEFDVIGAG